jgi:hypothetical protein
MPDGNGGEHIVQQIAHLMSQEAKKQKGKGYGPTIPFRSIPPNNLRTSH